MEAQEIGEPNIWENGYRGGTTQVENTQEAEGKQSRSLPQAPYYDRL